MLEWRRHSYRWTALVLTSNVDNQGRPPPASSGKVHHPTTILPLMLIAVGVSADAFAVALGKGCTCAGYSSAWRRCRLAARHPTGPLHHQGRSLGRVRAAAAADRRQDIGEAFINGPDKEENEDRISLHELLVLSVATSVAALAVGPPSTFTRSRSGWRCY